MDVERTSIPRIRRGMGDGLGVVTLLQGKLHYQNWWHAPVFAPFAIVVGALDLFVAFKERRF
jgi:hypothetical protein